MQSPYRDLPERIIADDAKLDQFTESGSDDQNNFELAVPAVEALMKEFEQGDETIKGIRDKSLGFGTQYGGELTKLNSNIR